MQMTVSDVAISLVKIVGYEVGSENYEASTSSQKVIGSDGSFGIKDITSFVE